MENRPYTLNETAPKLIAVHIDPQILADFPEAQPDPTFFKLVPAVESQYGLFKKNGRLWVQFPEGEFCDYPYYLKNITHMLLGLKTTSTKPEFPTEPFKSLIKTTESIEKKIFSNTTMRPGENAKDLWDEIIKKINLISAESHSLSSLVEKILDVPFLHKFHTSLIVLHLKGQTKAEIIGSMWRGEKVKSLIEVKDFNSFFNSIKKSKIKSFSADTFPNADLPFNGSFLAKEVISKKYSLIAVVSRHDFLGYSPEEAELFETSIDLLQPHFERLIDQEFSDKKISELRVCLKDFPLPLRIKDHLSGSSFLNDLYTDELQDQDIFFNKKVKGPFTLDLYDSDELRHYAFDLFHFQRISLLGELLNTLRHELSNPLFGLKLGSQIFTTFEVSEDNKSIMKEIEKNVNRCQIIIENFSNLYQIQSEDKPVSLKKMIDESLMLSKSESREVKKSITYHDQADEVSLNVPIIFVVQILFNLIVNACQAMRQSEQRGELKMDIHLRDQQVHIDMVDNGPGIQDDKTIQLFKPFFTTKAQGTGLGLVLSRNLALKMGGNLEYLVNNNLSGAHFRLTLPVT